MDRGRRRIERVCLGMTQRQLDRGLCQVEVPVWRQSDPGRVMNTLSFANSGRSSVREFELGLVFGE